MTSTFVPSGSIRQRFGKLPFSAASGDNFKSASDDLSFLTISGMEESSYGSISSPNSSGNALVKQLISSHEAEDPTGRSQYWSESESPKPRAMISVTLV